MFTKYDFSKSWRSPADFPTVETDEAQVREDLQILHDETRNALWALIDALAEGSAAANLGVMENGTATDLQTLLTGLLQQAHSHGSLSETERLTESFRGLSPTPELTDTDDMIPTARAVLEQLKAAGSGDMLQTIYDPGRKETDIFAYTDAGLSEKAPAGFGLGETAAVCSVTADANEATACGWYRVSSTTANCPSQEGLLRTDGYSSSHAVQTLFCFSAADGLLCRRRFCLSGVWGPWEWVDPPMIEGVEYRTTGRYRGKAVYQKLIDCGSLLAAGNTKSVALDISGLSDVVDYQVYTKSESGNVFVLPRLSLYEGSPSLTGYVSTANRNVVLQCIADLSASTGHIQINYTKD